MKKETFKAIPNYEGYYEISDQGRVRSVARTIARRDGFQRRVCEKIILPSEQRFTDKKTGKIYTTMVFCLRKDLKTELYPAVHAMLMAFFPGEYEVGTYKITYKDGNPRNVALSNIKFEFYDGRYGGYVTVKKGNKAARKFRSIAQAGTVMKFEHDQLFDKKTPNKLKGMKIRFDKPFSYKGKTYETINL